MDGKIHAYNVCACQTQQNGATCTYDTDCGFAGATCDPETCQCVGGPTGGSGGTGGVGGDGAGGSGASSSGGSTGEGVGECTTTCSVDDDCGAFPDETCVGGKCVGDCNQIGCSMHTCITVNGNGECSALCQGDSDCSGFGVACGGVADDGVTKFCEDGCSSDADCVDAYTGSVCVGGVCRCQADGDCSDDVYSVCDN